MSSAREKKGRGEAKQGTTSRPPGAHAGIRHAASGLSVAPFEMAILHRELASTLHAGISSALTQPLVDSEEDVLLLSATCCFPFLSLSLARAARCCFWRSPM